MEEEIRRGGHIPQETVEEILVKLPVKSMMRFKAVSKEWRGTLESKYFIEKHIVFQKSRRGHSRILSLSREVESYHRIVFDSILFSTNGIVHEIYPYLPIKYFNGLNGFAITMPCDGLICLHTDTAFLNSRISIFNPATTCWRSVPHPAFTIPLYWRRAYTLLGIGREKSERRRYKVVCFYEFVDIEVNKSKTLCKVFCLDSNTWRHVEPPPHCRLFFGHPLEHLDGVIYGFTDDQEHDKVLAFDLHTHKFQSLSTNPDIKSIESGRLGMRVLNHRLCIFQCHNDNMKDPWFRIWCLDINKTSFEMMYTVDLSNFPPLRWGVIPIATINNSIVVTSDYSHKFWLLYDSKNHNICRTFYLLRDMKTCIATPYVETLVSPYQ